MAQAPEGDVEKLFEDAFAEAGAAAEKNDTVTVPAKTPEEIAAEQKEALDAAAAQKVADDAAAAQKVADDAAVALAEANKGKTPEQIAADQKAVDDAAAQKVLDDKAVADKKVTDDAAAAKAAADKAAESAKPPEETPEQKAAREQFEASIKPYEPTEDEKKALAKFKEDFPNEAAAVEARLKSVDRDINARVYQAVQAVLQHVNGRLAPVETRVSETTLQSHLDALHKAHADYDQVVEKIPAWIKTQAALLQPTLQAAYDDGDTQSVLDLVAMYKKDTGVSTVGKTAEQIAAEQRVVDEAAAKKKKADEEAAALAPVSGKRTTTAPRGQPDPNDFDAAFNEAAAAAAGGMPTFTQSSPSTSEAPERDDEALPPCLATTAPQAAAMIAARVEIL